MCPYIKRKTYNGNVIPSMFSFYESFLNFYFGFFPAVLHPFSVLRKTGGKSIPEPNYQSCFPAASAETKGPGTAERPRCSPR